MRQPKQSVQAVWEVFSFSHIEIVNPPERVPHPRLFEPLPSQSEF